MLELTCEKNGLPGRVLLSLTLIVALALCLSLFLLHQRPSSSGPTGSGYDAIAQGDRFPALSSFLRPKRELNAFERQHSFLQLNARRNEKPIRRGNVISIPWTVAVQRGEAVSVQDNKIIVQQDSYYMVYGQVLFLNPDSVMGHLIQRRKSSVSGTEPRFTDLLLCLQEMPKNRSVNSCYTAGIVKLDQDDQLDLVIPDRPQAEISLEADSTFFGIIQLV
ncbi:tumor necrosis factor ligand superfamily member 13B isoform X2 [Amia ocellicauda]|uniref:tumor necrosis factor ligand superfamily member 13B isoform X2 n=1 Tax=Amia ocellicauda TaxID=2972642 RepID=UPI003464E846